MEAAGCRRDGEAGQATVEWIGLLLLVAVLLTGQRKGKLFARAVFGDISARLEERKHFLTGIR